MAEQPPPLETAPSAPRFPVPSAGMLCAIAALLAVICGGGSFYWKYHRQAALVDYLKQAGGFAELAPALPEGIRSRLKESWLKGLDRVTAVHLVSSRISDPTLEVPLARISVLSEVDTLSLRSGVTDEALGKLGGLQVLDRLQIGAERITDEGLIHLAGQKRLKHLSLWGAAITDEGLRHLADLQSLERLDLPSARITGEGLRHIAGLPALRRLDLGGTRITDESLRHLAGLTTLEQLNLSSTPVTGEGTRHLTGLARLHWLTLDSTNLTDAQIPHLCKLPHLSGCSMMKTAVTDKGEFELMRAHPGCNPFR